jgi:CubicO group peptidase (beta-lactamase class C family)
MRTMRTMHALLVIAMWMPAVAAAEVDVWKSPMEKRIDAVMSPWANKGSPGCAVGVVQDGKVVHKKGYGMADLERGVPIAPDTVFDIGSVSKQFTAAAIHLLAAEKKLSLDDDIRKHVPELPQVGKGVVTIRHLLHHTGGLRDYTALLTLGGTRIEDVATVRQTLAALARQKGVDFEPGAKHQYSNTGYFVLAQVAERASKQSMARFVDARIFTPLGMTASLVLDDHARLVPGRAIGYGPKKEGGWRLDMSQWEQTGDGAVQTSVLDLVKWDADFDSRKVGGAALVEALQVRGKTSDGKALDYASGLFHGTYRGQATVSHGGAWAGYRAELMRFPAQRTSIIVLCNASSAQPTAMAREIADIVLEKKLDPAPPKPAAAPAHKLSPAGLDAWAGTYRDAKGDVFTIVRAGDKLTVDAGGTTIELVPTGERTTTIAGTPIVIERAGTAPKRTVTLRAKTDEVYQEVAPFKPTAAELSSLAGRYTCPELATDWTFTASGGTLTFHARGIDDGSVLHTKADELALPGAGITLTATRTPKGVAALTLSGAMPIRCDRVP